MTFLFTGACGYIGSHSAFAFLKNIDCDIIIVDNLTTGFIENFEFLQNAFGSRVRFYNADLSRIDDVLDGNKIDGIVHFGASISVNESMLNPAFYYANNTIKTHRLITSAIKYRIKNFIFSSTAAVYGEPDIELIPIKETAPLNPINPYGRSKMMTEMMLKDIALASGLNYVILRYFNVAGACAENDYKNGFAIGQRSKNATHLIKIATECAVGKRDKMSIYGDDYNTFDGTCVRDYIHIDDLANAHIEALKILLSNNKTAEIFNVGYNRGFSVKEVIECVKKHAKRDFEVNIDERRSGDPAILIANNEKLLHNTNWNAKYNDIDFIIQSALNWEEFLK